jgi:RimJ/RimL family protein N-acetyltransferase
VSAPPILTTARLELVAPTAAHFADSAALWSDPDVVRHIGGRAFTQEEVWGRVLRYIGHWSALGFGYWVARERLTGAFVGELGFADWRREMSLGVAGQPEAGWVISPAAHGHGYATEGMQAALAWADANLGAHSWCIIDPLNTASLRVADKLGYREIARTLYRGDTTIVLQR